MGLKTPTFDPRSRFKAAGIHLSISVAVAMLAAALVFFLWYPWPYRNVSGGRDLFLLVMSVDLVLGPLLTFAIFDKTKGWRHLTRDLGVIAVIQLAGLGYGLYTVFQARPIAMVYEVDRFRVITNVDVSHEELSKADPQYQSLPLTGPWTLGTRSGRTAQERNDALFKGLEGVDVSQRPQFWQPYELSKATAVARSRPVDSLLKQYPQSKEQIAAALRDTHLSLDKARFLPLMGRQEWVVLLSPTGDIVGFLPLAGFF